MAGREISQCSQHSLQRSVYMAAVRRRVIFGEREQQTRCRCSVSHCGEPKQGSWHARLPDNADDSADSQPDTRRDRHIGKRRGPCAVGAGSTRPRRRRQLHDRQPVRHGLLFTLQRPHNETKLTQNSFETVLKLFLFQFHFVERAGLCFGVEIALKKIAQGRWRVIL